MTSYRGVDLELELVDPGSIELVRLFRHAGGEWEPPPTRFRTLRVDPPPGRQDEYAVLYTADTLAAAACECKVLMVDARDRYSYDPTLCDEYKVVRYSFTTPLLTVPIDGRNAGRLGLDGGRRPLGKRLPFQEAAAELHQRYGRMLHGLSWESFHRNKPGRVYALWHHRKEPLGLRIVSPRPFGPLADDDEWASIISSTAAVPRQLNSAADDA